MVGTLLLLSWQDANGHAERTVELSGYEVDIGRDNKCAVVLNDPSVSRRHCRLARYHHGDIWRIEDLNSSNGTMVNGRPLAAGPKSISVGDEIRCGAHAAMRLILSPPSAGRSNGSQASSERGVTDAPSSGNEGRCFQWTMMALLSAVLNEESARRRDAEHQLARSQAEALRLRELRSRLVAVEARREQAERQIGDALKDAEDARQKLRTRNQQLEEAQISIRLLMGRLERFEREQIATRCDIIDVGPRIGGR